MNDGADGAQPPPGHEPSTGDLVKQLSALVRDELKLAQVEMTRKGKQAGVGVGMLGGGGLVGSQRHRVSKGERSRRRGRRSDRRIGQEPADAREGAMRVQAWPSTCRTDGSCRRLRSAETLATRAKQ